jgi:hypothetical protein
MSTTRRPHAQSALGDELWSKLAESTAPAYTSESLLGTVFCRYSSGAPGAVLPPLSLFYTS